MQARCVPSREGACTWQRFLAIPLLQVIFWEGQWWAFPCFPPLLLGSLKAIAVSHKDPLGDVCLGSCTDSCVTYLGAGRRCQPALLRVLSGSRRGVQCSHSPGRLQLAGVAEDGLVEVAAKFPVAAVLSVFLGSCWKLPSHCCVAEAMRVLADRAGFGSSFSSFLSVVFGVTLESVFQASCITCWKVFSVEACSCRFINLCVLGGGGRCQNDAELNPCDFFFLAHWLAYLSVCPPFWPFQLPCILPPPLCSCPPDKFGVHICGSVITLAGFKMSHCEICLWLDQCESRVLSWLQAGFSSSCWGSFLLASVEAAKGTSEYLIS